LPACRACSGRWPRSFETNGRSLFDWSPSVDISENGTEYLIRADLPAVRKEDVHVTFDDGIADHQRRAQAEVRRQGGENAPRGNAVTASFRAVSRCPTTSTSASIRAESKGRRDHGARDQGRTEPKKPTEIKCSSIS
jgi:HSP20 family protein